MKIAIFSYKGGSAKTTTTLNLAAALLERDAKLKLRLVDLDLSRALSDYQQALPTVEFRNVNDGPIRELLAGTYDHALIDCRPAQSSGNAADTFAAVDLVLIPTPAQRRAAEEALEAAQVAIDAGKPVRFVLVQYNARHNFCRRVKEEMTAKAGARLSPVIVPTSPAFGEAEYEVTTALQHSPNSTGARAYRRLAEEFFTWL